MSQMLQNLTSQFPPLPEHEASWRAIYMEPVMCSGERITVAVIAHDFDGGGALKTLSEQRLQALYGEQGEGVGQMIDIVVNAALNAGQSLIHDAFKAPLSGFYLGKVRQGLGDNRDDILQQAASLTSSFYDKG